MFDAGSGRVHQVDGCVADVLQALHAEEELTLQALFSAVFADADPANSQPMTAGEGLALTELLAQLQALELVEVLAR